MCHSLIHFPPASYLYTNVYDGHTQGAGPAFGAGCNFSPGFSLGAEGVFGQIWYFPSWEQPELRGELIRRIVQTMCQ